MDRRLVGVLVLAGTVLLALVLPIFLRVPSPGQAQSLSLGTPEPGNCVQAVTTGALRVVSCDEPHTGEVPLVLNAVPTPPTTGQRFRAGGGQSCFSALPGYFAAAAALQTGTDTGWVPASLDYSVSLVGTTASSGYPACVISPALSSGTSFYTGHIAAVQLGDTTTLALHECFTSVGADTLTGCAQAHAGELLATRIVPVTTTDTGSTAARLDPAELQEQCERQAATLIGGADPTFAGRVRITAAVTAVRAPGVTSGAATTRVTCTAWAATGWSLTGSLFALGAADPPLTAHR